MDFLGRSLDDQFLSTISTFSSKDFNTTHNIEVEMLRHLFHPDQEEQHRFGGIDEADGFIIGQQQQQHAGQQHAMDMPSRVDSCDYLSPHHQPQVSFADVLNNSSSSTNGSKNAFQDDLAYALFISSTNNEFLLRKQQRSSGNFDEDSETALNNYISNNKSSPSVVASAPSTLKRRQAPTLRCNTLEVSSYSGNGIFQFGNGYVYANGLLMTTGNNHTSSSLKGSRRFNDNDDQVVDDNKCNIFACTSNNSRKRALAYSLTTDMSTSRYSGVNTRKRMLHIAHEIRDACYQQDLEEYHQQQRCINPKPEDKYMNIVMEDQQEESVVMTPKKTSAALSSARAAAIMCLSPKKFRFPSVICGESRLIIKFISLGSVGSFPRYFGKRNCGIPHRLNGTHVMYDQPWKFEVNHLVQCSSIDFITWNITNLISKTVICVTETPQDVTIRESCGRTICNLVVKMALDARAKELETELSEYNREDNPAAYANTVALIKSLRPKRCTIGLLFFGLLHFEVQRQFAIEMDSRGRVGLGEQTHSDEL